MTHFLLAADTVHTAAAACDYLADRLDAADVVTVVTVVEPDAPARDAGDAANVAAVRLEGLASVETVTREGEPADVVLELATGDVDEVVMGAGAGTPDAGSGLGGTARAVLEAAPVPVVVLPAPSFEAGEFG